MMERWTFTGDIVETFDDHIIKSIPYYEDIHSMIAEMSNWFIEDHSNVYDLGTSTGNAISTLLKNHLHRPVSYIGFDASLDMVEKTKRRFAGHHSVSIQHKDITDPSIRFTQTHLITAVFTMAFIPIHKRQPLFDRIYNDLNEGGAFIMVDKMAGNTAFTETVWRDLYHDWKERNGFSSDEIRKKDKSLRGVMHPLPLSENMDRLKRSGFEEVDVFFKCLHFTGIIARKGGATREAASKERIYLD